MIGGAWMLLEVVDDGKKLGTVASLAKKPCDCSGNYKLTGQFPSTERYALVDQIRRAAYSIPSNIVEGHSKNSRKEFL